MVARAVRVRCVCAPLSSPLLPQHTYTYTYTCIPIYPHLHVVEHVPLSQRVLRLGHQRRHPVLARQHRPVHHVGLMVMGVVFGERSSALLRLNAAPSSAARRCARKAIQPHQFRRSTKYVPRDGELAARHGGEAARQSLLNGGVRLGHELLGECGEVGDHLFCFYFYFHFFGNWGWGWCWWGGMCLMGGWGLLVS